MPDSIPDSPLLSPTRRPRKGLVRRCETCCWAIFTHIPLVFVYSLTTWAVWVEISLSRMWAETSWKGISYSSAFAAMQAQATDIRNFRKSCAGPRYLIVWACELVLHRFLLYRSRIAVVPDLLQWLFQTLLFPPPHARASGSTDLHGESFGGDSILQKMQGKKAGSSTSLFYMPSLCS